jgi:thioredoxin-dependent peroxiredoxin
MKSKAHSFRVAYAVTFVASLMLALGAASSVAAVPKVGDGAPNFTLKTLDDIPVELKQIASDSAVVIVVLRGWPGYQCPLCTRQVQDFVAKAPEFEQRKARILMVYLVPRTS